MLHYLSFFFNFLNKSARNVIINQSHYNTELEILLLQNCESEDD